jgi:3-oxoadipate enol-lactonase
MGSWLNTALLAVAATAVLVRLLSRAHRRSKDYGIVTTPDAVALPSEQSGPHDGELQMVVAHGLGGSNPSTKDHTDDATRPLILPILATLGIRAVWYTARGHGESTGWEHRGAEQFMWPRLARDLLVVASAHSLDRFVGAGNSLGAATVLMAALQHPERFRGLVLYRPPTFWEERAARKHTLRSRADELRREYGQGWPYAAVLDGSAATDLPASDDSSTWSRLHGLPILILCHGEDGVHPVSSGTKLQELLPHATLEVAENQARAEETFPSILCSWMESLR